MPTYKKATNKQKQQMKELAADAMRARLYIPGWSLCSELIAIRDEKLTWPFNSTFKTYKSISIAYDGTMPIGVCITRSVPKMRRPVVMVFVRKQYRRRGIGTELIDIATEEKSFVYCDGLRGVSDLFYLNFKKGEYRSGLP